MHVFRASVNDTFSLMYLMHMEPSFISHFEGHEYTYDDGMAETGSLISLEKREGYMECKPVIMKSSSSRMIAFQQWLQKLVQEWNGSPRNMGMCRQLYCNHKLQFAPDEIITNNMSHTRGCGELICSIFYSSRDMEKESRCAGRLSARKVRTRTRIRDKCEGKWSEKGVNGLMNTDARK